MNHNKNSKHSLCCKFKNNLKNMCNPLYRLLIPPHLCGFVRILVPLSAHIFRKSEKIRIFDYFQNLDSLMKSVFFCINIQCPHRSAFLVPIIRIFDRNQMSSLSKLFVGNCSYSFKSVLKSGML